MLQLYDNPAEDAALFAVFSSLVEVCILASVVAVILISMEYMGFPWLELWDFLRDDHN
jgi:hypothetical protein